jgi:type II secretion system protein N
VSSPPVAAAPFPLLPRGRVRRALVLAAAYLALTLVFVVTGFPADRLAPRVAGLASAATGSQVQIGELDVDLVALLPALHAREVTVTAPGGTRLQLDRVRARPAWSLSWLRGDPALALSLRAGEGRVDGVVRLGSTPGFTGDFEQVDLRLLPAALLGGLGVSLDGRLAGELDVRMAELGPEGELEIHAGEGSLALPNLPIGIPYQSIDVEATLGGEQLASIASLVVDGPMVALDASGTVGRGPTPPLAPLALQARIEVREPALRDLFSGTAVALGPDGAADLAIGGTLSEPQVAPGRPAPGAPRRR